jgi:hypothetical protein
MKPLCFLLLASLALASGVEAAKRPASRPTTAPALVDLAPLEAAVGEARVTLTTVKNTAVAQWQVSAEFLELKADADAKRVALETARAGNDPKAKLDASAAYNKARLGLEAETKRVVGTATQVQERALAAALASLDQAKRENVKRAADALANDPMEKAIREERILVGMTEAQVARIFHYQVRETRTPEGVSREYQERYPQQALVGGVVAGGGIKRRVTIWFVDGKVVDFQDSNR